MEAARARPDVIISHLPRMTAASAECTRLIRRSPVHLAFSFNFTDLPQGLDRQRLKAAFQRVDRFCVYSRFERELYSHHFSLDPERISVLDWTQDPPRVNPGPAPLPPMSYVSAIGGEGRDYDTLIDAAGRLPHLGFIIVARPSSINRPLPPNVQVHYNLPADITWRIAADSLAMVLPLRSDTTCCGQITIVGARLLGIPIVASASHALQDYLAGTATYRSGNHAQLTEVIEHMAANRHEEWHKAQALVESSRARFDRKHWELAVTSFLAESFPGRSF
jgi:hypothetical protein